MHCEQCGAAVRPGARYCASCGSPVGDPPPAGERNSAAGQTRLGRLIGGSRTERLLAVGTAVAVLIALAAFIALDAPDDDPTVDAFTAAADARCVAAKRTIARAGQRIASGGAEASRASFVGSVLEAVTVWRVQLAELVPARGDQAEAAVRLDDALAELLIELGALARVTRDGEEEAIASRAAAADAASVGVEQAIIDLGLDECASRPLGVGEA